MTTNSEHVRSTLLKTLQTYINIVNQYRLHLFYQYIQSNESYKYQDLFNVRKKILNRFESVIIELEQIIENLQTYRLSIIDVQQRLNQPIIKEAIEISLNANLFSVDNQKEFILNTYEWNRYKRDLEEIKNDLYIFDLLIHRNISKIDQLMNITKIYI